MLTLLRILHRSAFLLVAASCLSGCISQPLHEATRTIEHDHAAESGLRVESANGSITVQKTERDNVQIVAHLRAISPERLEAAKTIIERKDDKTLAIRVAWPEDKRLGNEGCSFEIHIPDAVGLHLKTSNGKLQAVGLRGNAELRTSNGRVEIQDHSGPVIAKSSNGNIVVKGVSGAIDTETSNGKITIVGAPDSVRAKSSNGALRISFAPESTGPIDAHTSNGTVELELGTSFAGHLSLTTSNGSIELSELPSAQLVSSGKKHTELAFGDADHKSEVRTSNGSIRVRSVTTTDDRTESDRSAH
jgi:DUF4097 and DUF4098 domain-containing protein YvlB